MAPKTATKSNPALAIAIAQVQPALAAWRKGRRHRREPIPKALWRRMVSLARRYGLSPVAQALGVNYSGLKAHLVASASAPASPSGNVHEQFVEVPLTVRPDAPQWVIELEDCCGSRLTLRLAQSNSAAALALAQGLWSCRS